MRTAPSGPTAPRDLRTAALLAAAVFICFAPFAVRGVDLHHDGLMFKTALDVARGKTLFSETFAQYGAFTSWLQGGLLRLFGEELRVLKFATVTGYAAAAGAFYLLWRRELALPRGTAAAAIGVWALFAYFFDADWTMLPWSSVFALPIQAAIFFAVARERPFLAGLLCGVAYLFRQPVGVSMLGGSLLAFALLSRARVRKPALALAGFALVLGIFLARVRLTGTWDAWLLQNWTFPRMMADRMGSYHQFGRKLFWEGYLAYPLLVAVPAVGYGVVRAPRAVRYGGLAALLLLELALGWAAPDALKPLQTPGGWRVFVPVMLALAGASQLPRFVRHWRDLDRETRVVLAFTILALCSWSQYFPVPCKRHVLWGITPGIGLFVYWLHRLAGRRTPRTLAWMLLLFFPALVQDARLARAKLLDRRYELVTEGPLRGMRIDLSSRDGPRLGELHRRLRELARAHPEVPLLLESPNAIYLPLVPNQDQPDPIFVHWPDLRKTAWQDPARERFLAERLPWVIAEGQPDEAIFWLMRRYRYRILWQSEKSDNLENQQVTLLGVDR